MENLHDLMTNRRSIRRFTQASIPAEDVKLIMEAALMAPTSKSSRPWHFVLVDDRNTLERLSQCRQAGSGPIAKCRLAVVVCADSSLTGPWIEDATIAATYIQLQAQDLGLGSVWIQVRDRFDAEGVPADENIQGILGIPDTISVECVVAIGYPDEAKNPQNLEKLLWERVHIGGWNPEQTQA
ncbi:MAG: nitroreductase family protein [Muribaculaceae bacterium]|nr:nitroreductase family protein [Muribaculaceae bacterium]